MPGVRGAQSKSARQRELDGSRTRARHYDQPAPPAGDPPKPVDLTALEALHWDELVEVLRARGQLTADLGQWLRSVVQAWAMMMQWHETAKTTPLIYEKTDMVGNVIPVPHPVHVQSRLSRKAYIEALKEGGLTPASVARVKLLNTKKPEVDPFAAFQARGGLRAVK